MMWPGYSNVLGPRTGGGEDRDVGQEVTRQLVTSGVMIMNSLAAHY